MQLIFPVYFFLWLAIAVGTFVFYWLRGARESRFTSRDVPGLLCLILFDVVVTGPMGLLVSFGENVFYAASVFLILVVQVLVYLMVNRNRGGVLRRFFVLFGLGLLVAVVASGTLIGADYAVAHSEAARKRERLWKEIGNLSLTGERFYLYSLDPMRRTEAVDSKEFFHGFGILGQVEITSVEEKERLLRSLALSVQEARYRFMCFDPHHGLRVVTKSGTVDFVICFTCGQAIPYGFNRDHSFGISGIGSAAFDAILRDHNLPVAEKAGKH